MAVRVQKQLRPGDEPPVALAALERPAVAVGSQVHVVRRAKPKAPRALFALEPTLLQGDDFLPRGNPIGRRAPARDRFPLAVPQATLPDNGIQPAGVHQGTVARFQYVTVLERRTNEICEI